MELFSVYRCSWCCRLSIVKKGNYHPWCGCGSDEFDWGDGVNDVTKEEAEKIVKENII